LTLRFHKEDQRTTHKTCPGRHVDKANLIAAIEDKMASAMPGEHPQPVPGAPAAGPVPAAPAQRNSFGWRPDIPDHRDYPYGAMRLGPGEAADSAKINRSSIEHLSGL
jgi:hypothetical protein